jgi:hypothetical protein
MGRAEAFEQQVGRRMRDLFPCSALSNVVLFRPDYAGDPDRYGYELDHVLHVEEGAAHRLVLVECKAQTIRDAKGNAAFNDWSDWFAEYSSPDGTPQRKDLKRQVRNQAQALRQNISPLPDGMTLSFEAWIVSSDRDTHSLKDDRDRETVGLVIRLYSEDDMIRALQSLASSSRVLRVEESEILRRIRQGAVVSDIGRPELGNALEYLGRCRDFIDDYMFKQFSPTKSRWAVNGSAGMGKSVLLAYCLWVLTSGKRITASQNGLAKALEDFDGRDCGWPAFEGRRIIACALRRRQLDVLKRRWERFRDEFMELASGQLPILPVEFAVWHDDSRLDCNVLVIDEAHDLTPAGQERIARWMGSAGEQRYLVIGCDRHQKLRLIGRDELMLNGVDFSLCTRKLVRNYRNPFPVFASALGLMFRWFADGGPKVIPTKDELANGLGLDVVQHDTSAKSMVLKNRNDAHPANAWSFVVSSFPSCERACAYLNQYRLRREDVLWVRFAAEDLEFDYEKTVQPHFTYHDVSHAHSASMVDKYIKGQEYPVVVIEGVPEKMNDLENEAEMWKARKELYLCASRATAFLFFIYNPQEATEATKAVRSELRTIVHTLSRPRSHSGPSGKEWQFEVRWDKHRPMDLFREDSSTMAEESVLATVPTRAASPPEPEPPECPSPEQRVERPSPPVHEPAPRVGAAPEGQMEGQRRPSKVHLRGVISVDILASKLRIAPEEVQRLLPTESKAKRLRHISIPERHATAVAQSLGVRLFYSPR